MIVGVQDVFYSVRDMRRAIAFYRDVLGLRMTFESEHWTALDVGGMRLGLHWTVGAPVPQISRAGDWNPVGATLTLRVSDIRAEVERLQAAGVTFIGGIHHESWGSTAAFEDPDGNLLKLMQPHDGERLTGPTRERLGEEGDSDAGVQH